MQPRGKPKMARFIGKKRIVLITSLAAILVMVAVYVKVSHRKPAATASPGSQPQNSIDSATPPPPAPQPAAPTGSTPPPGTPGSSSGLGKPTGQLVSNHHVSLSGTTEQTQEVSTCQTQPGATCDIRLSGPGGVIKTVGAKTTDDRGGVEFVWNVKDLGLSAGTWKVEAVASQNGQSGISDPDSLQVTQ
jgi:hypothetical protein